MLPTVNGGSEPTFAPTSVYAGFEPIAVSCTMDKSSKYELSR
jgi:hypothetical protein